MKPDKREEARRLRREEGLGLNEICRRIGAAKSSVSGWVRDIELTPEQKEALHKQHYAYRARLNGGHTNAIKAREQRKQYQEEGRAKAREGDPLHVAGCMLYWGEGAKARNNLELANSDVDMLKFFIKFLHQQLAIDYGSIGVRISCYLGNGLTVEEIENWWLEQLNLSSTSLEKTIINEQPRASSKQRGRKLIYGMCHIRVYSTRHVHHIYGAIQEYTGIEKPDWLM